MLSSWLGTDRFGGKSQWRDATADRFLCAMMMMMMQFLGSWKHI